MFGSQQGPGSSNPVENDDLEVGATDGATPTGASSLSGAIGKMSTIDSSSRYFMTPSASSSAIVARPAALTEPEEYVPHSKIVYYSALLLTPSIILGEIACGFYFRTYTAVGVTYTLQTIGVDTPDLDDDYGDLSTLSGFTKTAHPIAETAGWLSCATEIGNGLSLFDVTETPQAVDKFICDVLPKAAASFARTTCSSPAEFFKSVYRVAAYASLAGGAVANAYGDIEQFKVPVQAWCNRGPRPDIGMGGADALIGYIALGGIVYCGVGFGPNMAYGVEYWLKPTIHKRYQNHRSIAIELQGFFEAGVSIVGRYGLSFLMGRFAEQWGQPPAGYYGAGGVFSLAQGLFAFAPKSLVKYHKHVDVDVDGLFHGVYKNYKNVSFICAPKLESERQTAYKQLYGSMTKLQYLGHTIARMKIASVAQSELGVYMIAAYAVPAMKQALESQNLEWLAYTLASLMSLVSTGLSLYPLYKGTLYKELNDKVFENKVDAYKKLLRDARDRALLADDKKTPEEERSEAIKLVLDIDRLAGNPNSTTLVLGASAAQPVLPAVEDLEEKEEKQKPSRCAEFWGTGFSATMNILRMFSLASSLINNKQIGKLPPKPKQDYVAIGLPVGAIVGENRHINLAPPSINTFNKLFSSRVFTACGNAISSCSSALYSACRRKPASANNLNERLLDNRQQGPSI